MYRYIAVVAPIHRLDEACGDDLLSHSPHCSLCLASASASAAALMIRSSQIPSLLHRICGNGIVAAMVVTADGELLGTSFRKHSEQIADKATLITDVILDYIRLGTELHQFKLQYVELEMSLGMIGVASAGPEFFVIALADDAVVSGSLKSRVLACAAHVHDSFMPMTDAS